MKEFVEKILQTLKTNGFPQKRVSLPTEKMYEVADSKGFSFNQVLEQLKSEHQIVAQIGDEKIVFSQEVAETSFAGMDGLAGLAGMDPQEMMKQAQEMMTKMDPAELKKLQEMFTNMSDEQKEEVMKKGKDLGII